MEKYIKKITAFLFVFLFAFSFYTTTFAETRDVDIVTTLSPENPRPYEDVNINLNSYATDLDNAFIEWRAGNKVLLKRTGAKDYSVKMGAVGTQAILDVKIETEEGDVLQKRIIITPSDMDLLWQATNSYVPPFYKGKAMPSKESEVKITAIPSGPTGILSNNSNFTWKLNGETQQDQSGYRKNSFIFAIEGLQGEEKIEVSSSPKSNGIVSIGSMSISGANPLLLFYKKSPTDGIIYSEALNKEIFMKEDEMTIVAEPYFLSDKNNLNSSEYIWKINNEVTDTPYIRNQLTVHPTERGGYAQINLEIENTLKLFQKVSKGLILNL